MTEKQTRQVVEVMQSAALKVRNGDVVRLPGETQWHLVVENICDAPHTYKGSEDVEKLWDRLDDDFYVLFAMNDLPNRLELQEYTDRLADPATKKEYDGSGPPLRLVAMFIDALVDVQVYRTVEIEPWSKGLPEVPPDLGS